MAMAINEYSDGEFKAEIVEDFHVTEGLNIDEAAGDLPIDPNSLMVEIEGIHAYPHATRNFTRYMPKALKNSISSWTNPYNRPLIRHHNEKNGDIIGRIIQAEYLSNKTFSGTPALLFTVNIPGEEAKASVKNGTENTVSIGVIAHDVRCSVCGQQLATGESCSHERGAIYDGETCYWDIHSIEAKELSYVVVPSDIYAKNRKVYSASGSVKKSQVAEGFDGNMIKGEQPQMANENKSPELATAEATIVTLQAKIKENEAKIAEVTSAKEALDAKIAELEESVKTLKDEASEAATMKEGLEAALEEAKISAKESLIDAAQAWRKVLGKREYDAEDIKNRSEDAIRCSIKDMKEELADSNAAGKNINEGTEDSNAEPKLPQKINEPPTAVEDSEEELQKKAIKEETERLRSVNLEEGLASLFGGVVGRY